MLVLASLPDIHRDLSHVVVAGLTGPCEELYEPWSLLEIQFDGNGLQYQMNMIPYHGGNSSFKKANHPMHEFRRP